MTKWKLMMNEPYQRRVKDVSCFRVFRNRFQTSSLLLLQQCSTFHSVSTMTNFTELNLIFHFKTIKQSHCCQWLVWETSATQMALRAPGLSCQHFKQRKHKNINLQTEMCSFQRMIKHFYKSSFLEAINSWTVFKSTHLQATFYFYLATYCQFVQEWYFRGFKGGKS